MNIFSPDGIVICPDDPQTKRLRRVRRQFDDWDDGSSDDWDDWGKFQTLLFSREYLLTKMEIQKKTKSKRVQALFVFVI